MFLVHFSIFIFFTVPSHVSYIIKSICCKFGSSSLPVPSRWSCLYPSDLLVMGVVKVFMGVISATGSFARTGYGRIRSIDSGTSAQGFMTDSLYAGSGAKTFYWLGIKLAYSVIQGGNLVCLPRGYKNVIHITKILID